MLKPAHAIKDVRSSRLEALLKRHAEISEKIDSVYTHHKSISDFYVAELKRQKLRIKDMIEEVAAHTARGDAQRA